MTDGLCVSVEQHSHESDVPSDCDEETNGRFAHGCSDEKEGC